MPVNLRAGKGKAAGSGPQYSLNEFAGRLGIPTAVLRTQFAADPARPAESAVTSSRKGHSKQYDLRELQAWYVNRSKRLKEKEANRETSQESAEEPAPCLQGAGGSPAAEKA